METIDPPCRAVTARAIMDTVVHAAPKGPSAGARRTRAIGLFASAAGGFQHGGGSTSMMTDEDVERGVLADQLERAYMTSMALSAAKRTTTLILDAETDRLLDRAARERGVSRSEFIRAQLRRALEQYKTHPKPRSAGAMRRTRAPVDEEAEVFAKLER
jgi:Arc/MetJ-type ribon-helix-helix transcriptional regulator